MQLANARAHTIFFMHAYIVSGGNQEERTKKIKYLCASWKISPFDIVHITQDETSIGISDVRDFNKRLQLKPKESEHLVGIIDHAEALTQQAQQALLKTLEEPPASVYILVSVTRESMLLPTILSRCQLISLSDTTTHTPEELEAYWQKLSLLMKATPGQVIAQCATFSKTKEDIGAFITGAIASGRSKLRDHTLSDTDKKHLAAILHKLLAAKEYETTNIALLAVVESIFLIKNESIV
jgi:hypothetical protein